MSLDVSKIGAIQTNQANESGALSFEGLGAQKSETTAMQVAGCGVGQVHCVTSANSEVPH